VKHCVVSDVSPVPKNELAQLLDLLEILEEVVKGQAGSHVHWGTELADRNLSGWNVLFRLHVGGLQEEFIWTFAYGMMSQYPCFK
jgi:hypothetical protein